MDFGKAQLGGLIRREGRSGKEDGDGGEREKTKAHQEYGHTEWGAVFAELIRCRLLLNFVTDIRKPLPYWIAGALAIYFLLGAVLIAQKPGLQYDEALLVAGAVHMEHSPTAFELESTPDAWVCRLGRCFPLMSFLYIGPLKEYAMLPWFAALGPRTSVIRLVSLLFGAFAIWGVYRLIVPWFGATAAGFCAVALAINPSFLNMVVFDNNAIGVVMVGLGLTCAAVSLYGERRSVLAAFCLGAAMGFGVWNRANFVWLLVGGAAAGVIVFRRRILIPLSHAGAIAVGGVVGGFPFLLYQYVSNGATWKAQEQFTGSRPMAALLRERAFLFADTLLSDGEHRAMWAGPSLPAWQLWFFPSLLFLAAVICVMGRAETQRRLCAQSITLTMIFTGAIIFFSRLPVAEHHLILLLPLAVAIVVMACWMVWERMPRLRSAPPVVFALYAACCLYWQFESARGLKETGGTGVWSNRGLELAHYLDEGFGGRQVKMLDWGFEYNLYVLTDGRIKPKELFSQTSEDVSAPGRPWIDEIREGGVFVFHGAEHRVFPESAAGFLRALTLARPVIVRTHRVRGPDGTTYAQVIEVARNSIRAPGMEDADEITDVRITMGKPGTDSSGLDSQLTGFYPPEPGGFRWTKRQFSARLDLTHLARPVTGDLELVMHGYVPEVVIQKLGSLTLTGRFDGHPLTASTVSHAGQFVFRSSLNDGWIAKGIAQVDFQLDKAMAPSASDGRELGVAVTGISIEPE